jgi:phosphatidylglycerol:prolipoprotein diacylglycerol transferase
LFDIMRPPIEAFGIFLGVGLALGVVLSRRLAERSGLDVGRGASALVAALLGAFVAGRAVYVLGTGEPKTWPLVLAFGEGGFSGYGALFGGASAASFVLWRARAPIGAWLDVAAPGVLLTISIARLGCWLTGCDYGRPLSNTAPYWLIRLGTLPMTSGGELSPVGAAQLARHPELAGATWALPVHPTELYESIAALLLLVVSIAGRKWQRARGQLFSLATLAYAGLRYGLEWIRDDPDRGVFRHFTITQLAAWISMGLLGVAWTLRAHRTARST